MCDFVKSYFSQKRLLWNKPRNMSKDKYAKYMCSIKGNITGFYSDGSTVWTPMFQVR